MYRCYGSKSLNLRKEQIYANACNTYFGSSLPQVVCIRANVLFTLSVFVSVWWSTLCCVFVFLRLVFPMLPVFLDCPFLIALQVFSNAYFLSQHDMENHNMQYIIKNAELDGFLLMNY